MSVASNKRRRVNNGDVGQEDTMLSAVHNCLSSEITNMPKELVAHIESFHSDMKAIDEAVKFTGKPRDDVVREYESILRLWTQHTGIPLFTELAMLSLCVPQSSFIYEIVEYLHPMSLKLRKWSPYLIDTLRRM